MQAREELCFGRRHRHVAVADGGGGDDAVVQRGAKLSKARLKRVSSGPAWGPVLVYGSSPLWRTSSSGMQTVKMRALKSCTMLTKKIAGSSSCAQ